MQGIKSLSLKKNFSWNFIGSLIYSLSQWLIIVLLAKIGTPDMVGLYTLGLAITAPVLMFTNLQLRGIQATDTTDEYIFNDYFGLRINTGFVAILITLTIILISDYDLYKSLIIFSVALSKVIDSYSDVVYGHLQQKERMDFIGISRIVKGATTLIVVALTYLITNDLFLSLIIMNISWVVVFFAYDRRKIGYFVNTIKPNFDIEKHKKMILLALPLGIVLMLGSLNTNVPRIIIEKYLGEEALGYFAAIAYIMVAGNTFINAVGQAAVPRLAKMYKNKDDTFSMLLIRLVSLGFIVGTLGVIAAWLFGENALKIMYDGTYSEYNFILILVMVASIFEFSSSYLGHGLTSMRIFKVQPLIGLISLIVAIVSSIIFISQFQLVGAGITLIITSIVRFVLNLAVVIIYIKGSKVRSQKAI